MRPKEFVHSRELEFDSLTFSVLFHRFEFFWKSQRQTKDSTSRVGGECSPLTRLRLNANNLEQDKIGIDFRWPRRSSEKFLSQYVPNQLKKSIIEFDA